MKILLGCDRHVDGLGVRTSYSLNAMLEAPSSGVVKRLQ
jgi:hypothetical protein